MMSNTETEKPEITLLSGEGQVTIRLNSEGIEIELFQQSTMREQLSFEDRNKLASWLVSNILTV